MEKKILCKDCGRVLAIINKGWVNIQGKTNYSSNGEQGRFKCTKCNSVNIIDFKKLKI